MKGDTIYKYEPLWGVWKIEKKLGEGSYGKVYKVYRDDFGKKTYSAVKIISISEGDDQIDDLRASGMNKAKIKAYCDSFINEISRELELMHMLGGHKNVVSCEDHMVKRHSDGIGADIILRMELLTPLTDYICNNGFMLSEVVRMGQDISRALEMCSMYDIVHRDVKPGNIFVAEDGSFKLGDFGIAKCMRHGAAEMSRKGTYSYMAPEVYHARKYDGTVDIYSLGIVMYRLLNSYRLPFLPLPPATIEYSENEMALRRRMQGEKLPPMCAVYGELADIVLKCCEFLPQDRYTSPTQLRLALEKVQDSGFDDCRVLSMQLCAGKKQEKTPEEKSGKTTEKKRKEHRKIKKRHIEKNTRRAVRRTSGQTLSAELYTPQRKGEPFNKGQTQLIKENISSFFVRKKNVVIISLAAFTAMAVIALSAWGVFENGKLRGVIKEDLYGKWVTSDKEMYYEFTDNGTMYFRNSEWDTSIGVFDLTDSHTIIVEYSGNTEKYTVSMKEDKLILKTHTGKRYILEKN